MAETICGLVDQDKYRRVESNSPNQGFMSLTSVSPAAQKTSSYQTPTRVDWPATFKSKKKKSYYAREVDAERKAGDLVTETPLDVEDTFLNGTTKSLEGTL